MSPALPEGEPVPEDGSLPQWVGGDRAGRAFGVYVHVPFCSVRCGYCDFNTYTAAELGGGANRADYANTALGEVALAARVMADAGVPDRPVSTVFFGGGTPTMLPARDLVRILHGIRDTWGLAEGAEVTTEANPDSVTPASLDALAAGGFTRISFGMQSAVPHVLATLDRTHDPRRIPQVVRAAGQAGLAVSLDLIYGTPGESLEDWSSSITTALDTGVKHVSAYALVVEPGTKMGAQVRRGLLSLPDDDDQAEKYELADDLLTAAGLHRYEVSNWSRSDADRCRHNLGYWRGDDWWGIGPGAHSYLAAAPNAGGHTGVRWWNVKHPRRYAALLSRDVSPGAGREILSEDDAVVERVMLGIRLSDGLSISEIPATGRAKVAGLIADGLVEGPAALRGRMILTRKGALLADAVVRALLGY